MWRHQQHKYIYNDNPEDTETFIVFREVQNHGYTDS
ncbi:hypothetical protein AA0113_g10791 [Alternaria arborescens]|uniref:Uncharacterized protein n=1 Tax=Alternaria arborescens TaxID=156630 RepID=A0A4Q4QJU7_9PLEO|nr:hypothetical protein AA0111_g6507 [Alternaria arborescens]RYN43242.1 hypothetical protein AA0112_g805 [Alternaria arborescens]RYO28571.1 hypothetical protein AA0111_g6507 [Alternaria arborescens]RYO43554.1 hypothetical protein AA0113_g10791 [Alternaria arborescens]